MSPVTQPMTVIDVAAMREAYSLDRSKCRKMAKKTNIVTMLMLDGRKVQYRIFNTSVQRWEKNADGAITSVERAAR